MLRSTVSLCLKKATAIDVPAALASPARRYQGGTITVLTARFSSYASSNALSDDETSGTSSTYFSSLSLANNVPLTSSISAHYSSSAASSTTAAVNIITSQVPSGMRYSTTLSPSQCYRTLEEPSVHEDYDGLELHHHAVSEKTQEVSYYDYSYDPDDPCEEEMGSIL
ncbi:hypothetical protein ACHAWC_006494 [Mediolabrus comicus]